MPGTHRSRTRHNHVIPPDRTSRIYKVTFGEGARAAPPTGESGRAAENPLAIADLGTGTDLYGRVKSFEEIRAADFLGAEELAAYDSGRPTGARLGVWSELPPGRTVIVVTRVADHATARGVADRLADLQHAYGLTDLPVFRGVHRLAATPPDEHGKATVRAHYVHGDLVVRMELTGRADAFTGLLAEQLRVLPADA